MDGKVNDYYNCSKCIFLDYYDNEPYCFESIFNPIKLTSKSQCRKCDSWSDYEFERFYHFNLDSCIKKKLTKKQIEDIWLNGRTAGKELFLHSNKFGR